MKECPPIGMTYMIKMDGRSYIWAVIENNYNNKTSKLTIIESCEERGTIRTVGSEMLLRCEPMGPILEAHGEVVIENGVEFIKPSVSQTLKKQI